MAVTQNHRDEQVGFLDLIKQFDKGSIQFGQGHFFNKSVHIQVQGFIPQQAGLVPEGTSQKAFTTASGPCNEDVFGSFYPGTVSQQTHLFTRKIALG